MQSRYLNIVDQLIRIPFDQSLFLKTHFIRFNLDWNRAFSRVHIMPMVGVSQLRRNYAHHQYYRVHTRYRRCIQQCYGKVCSGRARREKRRDLLVVKSQDHGFGCQISQQRDSAQGRVISPLLWLHFNSIEMNIEYELHLEEPDGQLLMFSFWSELLAFKVAADIV